jgi:beta-galactosidase
MNSSIIRNHQLLVNGQPFYLRGGEVQYFRLRIDDWSDRLKKAKEGGLNTISSYMPWYFHEPREGEVDLNGRTQPETNLARFLELAAELDLKVIARPGPFINSELRCGGFPEWLFRNYPETMSRRADGQLAPGRPLPAEGEPLYRQYVRKWYKAIVPLIARYDIHNGGPVILFQPDNELSAAWSFGLLNSLCDPTILKESWPRWLQETYKDIETVSDRHKKKYKSFDQVLPPRSFASTPAEKLCLDWLNFKRWFFADWGATLARWAMEDGIKVPFIFNEPVAGFYEHGDHAGFGAALKRMGISGATACHTYSPLVIDLEGATNISMAVALTRSSLWGGPPLAVEVNTTWYIPRLSRSEINWDPLMRLGLGSGLTGSVIYPYTAGRGTLQDVIDGPEYWDTSAIDVEGNISGGFLALQRFNRFVQTWENEIVNSELACDLSIAYSPSQRLLDFLGAPPLLDGRLNADALPGGESFSAEPVLNRSSGSPSHDWLDGYEGVSKQTVTAEAGLWKKTKEAALLLTRLNLAYDLREITNPHRPPGEGWILSACTGCMEKEAMDYLLAHLDNGGGVFFFPTIPVFDLDGRQDQRLADRLGVRLTNQIRPAGGNLIDYGTRLIDFGAGDQTGVNGWIFVHEFSSVGKVLSKYQGQPVIASSVLDKGQAVVGGLDISFTNVSGLRLWQQIFQNIMNIRPAVTVTGNYCHTLLRRGVDCDILTVMNLTGRKGPTMIHFRERNISFEIDLQPHEARCLVLGVDLAGKTQRLIYTTSEIIGLDADRRNLELYGREGTTGELAFARPVTALLDDRPITATPAQGGYYVLRYDHGCRPRHIQL